MSIAAICVSCRYDQGFMVPTRLCNLGGPFIRKEDSPTLAEIMSCGVAAVAVSGRSPLPRPYRRPWSLYISCLEQL